MGNLCGKQEPDSAPPGRVLGSAPTPQRNASVPVPVTSRVGASPRTLGGATDTTGEAADARRKAAEAAEARARASSKPGGKLQAQLTAQKRQSRADALKKASAEEQRAREIAQTHDSQTYN
ncbi:uncharacterized protein UV8b_02622 [Ustilaginoidea virens]|uniref:Uncharacterized protein n=1 Tax=Ustilaginoidea virens TaxID=1159556 RepID=A0A8E5MG99_USTVR|nr:uncharacterized protein UV8b_02622 [Ustilaginoidea virens]QUC18381.1 hypothetical protein UV8b_02622 [Ustilaginoidea virens]